MKLDSEQVLCHETISHKLESKAFDKNDNDLESIKSGNGLVKESLNRVFSDSVCEADGNGLRHSLNGSDGWTAPKLDCSMSVDGLSHDDEKSTRDFEEPVISTLSSASAHPIESDSIIYMDKNVMEREVPELTICYKDTTYHVVKDICIDEGVPSRDKFLFDTDVHEKSICTVLSPEKDATVKERVNLDLPTPDLMKSLPEKERVDPDSLNYSEGRGPNNNSCLGYGIDDVKRTNEIMDYASEKSGNVKSEEIQDALKSFPEKETPNPGAFNYSYEKGSESNFSPERGLKDVTANEELKEFVSLGDMLSVPNMGSSFANMKSSVNSMDEAELPSLQKPNHNATLATDSSSGEPENASEDIPAMPNPVTAAEESHEEVVIAISSLGSAADDAVLANPSLVSGAEESDSRHAKSATHASVSGSEESSSHAMDEPSYNSKAETRSITFDFDNSAPSSSGREESPQNAEPGHLGTKGLSRHTDPNSEPSSSRFPYGPGETSFSASGPVSGLITYSGPIAYSGSVSLRSDSSTTSTRSFAFPVLQTEWNSSPVRMAKADRRRFRKHRGWRHGLLCCRF